MYFPRLYPEELLYSGIARCRVHLGISNHKTLLHMLFGDSKVAAITDLPTHLTVLANNTGLDAAGLIERHTLFPIYAPFIPQLRRDQLFKAMLASNQSTIGLAGASTSLIKWPAWLRYCPICFEEMAARYGEPYWRRSWQIQGVDACPEHGCQLVDSPVPFRRAQRHEFHPASPLFMRKSKNISYSSEEIKALSRAAEQLLALGEVQSPGYGRWTNFYRQLATECDARRGQQIRADVVWERVLATHRREWLAENNLLAPTEPPPWILASFRKHRKGFSAVQHLTLWTSLRPDQAVGELIREANTHQIEVSRAQTRPSIAVEAEHNQQYRTLWQQALEQFGEAKAARKNGGQACYAWLYRHDRNWLLAANSARHHRRGNNSSVDWRKRDRTLVRLLIRMDKAAQDNLSVPRKSRNWFLRQLPHRSSVEHHLEQLPLCRAFLDRYTESVGEYQIRRLTRVLLENVRAGISERRWELERRCGLDKTKMAPMTFSFIRAMGEWIE